MFKHALLIPFVVLALAVGGWAAVTFGLSFREPVKPVTTNPLRPDVHEPRFVPVPDVKLGGRS